MSDRIDTEVHLLLGRLRRQRPLRSGSLLVTLLGDSIAPRGGSITLGSLIRLAAPFGLPERLVRTSVARLAQDGWLAARRSGRRSEYQLTERGRASFAAATRRIYGARRKAWDRRWTLLLLPPGGRASGSAGVRLRGELKWLGFGQITAGLWAHPGAQVEELRARLAEAALGADALLSVAVNASARDDQRLVAAGWNLRELSRAYARFVVEFAPLAALLHAGHAPSPATAFVLRTLLIHEYRKIHLRDPLLPDALLPADWIGTRAYELCGELYRGVYRRAERHLASQAQTLRGALAPASREARARFTARARSAS